VSSGGSYRWLYLAEISTHSMESSPVCAKALRTCRLVHAANYTCTTVYRSATCTRSQSLLWPREEDLCGTEYLGETGSAALCGR
jgi:hypothetical protein